MEDVTRPQDALGPGGEVVVGEVVAVRAGGDRGVKEVDAGGDADLVAVGDGLRLGGAPGEGALHHGGDDRVADLGGRADALQLEGALDDAERFDEVVGLPQGAGGGVLGEQAEDPGAHDAQAADPHPRALQAEVPQPLGDGGGEVQGEADVLDADEVAAVVGAVDDQQRLAAGGQEDGGVRAPDPVVLEVGGVADVAVVA